MNKFVYDNSCYPVSIPDVIKKIITYNLGVDPSEIKSDSTIYSLGGDSLDFVEFLMDIEEEYGIYIPDEKVAGTKTLGELVKLVEECKSR